MNNSFLDIIKRKSTEELLDIYNNHYLEYQEAFIDLCTEELRQRGVNITSGTIDLSAESKSQLQAMIVHRICKGESPTNVSRQLCHDGYQKDDIEKLVSQVQEQVATYKRENAISDSKAGLWIGPAIILVSLIWRYIASLIGYTIAFRHSIPVEFIGLFLGIIITVSSPIRLIRYSIKNKKKKS